MKLVLCVSFVSAFLCGGKAWTTNTPTTTDTWSTRRKTTTTTEMSTTTRTTRTTTTTPTYDYPDISADPGESLKGKMVTLSQSSGVTFYPPNYIHIATKATTAGVSVCLRFLADSSSIDLFTLAPEFADALSLSVSNQWYTLSWDRHYRYQVSLNPTIPLWSSVRTQPWTSVCVVADFIQNVVQVFQGGSVSIRKIPRPRMVWSGQSALKVSGFDGHVTDLEVWDFPLENAVIFRFMQNYGSSGNVLTWSDIAYKSTGIVLMEDIYSAFGQGPPISSSEGEAQPIRSRQGRDQRRRHKKKFNERRRRRRQML